MLFGHEPQQLFTHALEDFTNELVGLRDGDERAIHHSRVAIRRLRESFALVRADYDDDDLAEIEDRLRRVFKALGRARDADTAHHLVQHLESRFPLAPAALGQLRVEIARDRLRARQRVIKTLEAADIEHLAADLAGARRAQRRWLGSNAWRKTLLAHLARRALDVRQAMHRAGGVYFRKRTHNARVTMKQLRYALELADVTGVWRDGGGLRALRKAQDALGEAHDREVLIARVTTPTEGTAPNTTEAGAVQQFLTGEITALHERYLALRPAIQSVCDALLVQRRALPVRASAMAVAALMVPIVVARRRA